MTKTRAAYYLLLIALLMPALPDVKAPSAKPMQAKTAALEETAGMRNTGDGKLCSRQHGLCGATSYLLRKLEAKAKYPIHVLSNWSSSTTVRLPDHRA